MAYFASELAQAPPYTVNGVSIAHKPGCGYPTGDATRSTYYPTTPALGVTTNPGGNANSPGETGAAPVLPYGFKTWEQKAAAMVPPGVFA